MADLWRCSQRARSAHQEMLPCVTALLAVQQRELRNHGRDKTAEVLARLISSTALASLVHELGRRHAGSRAYYHPTILAEFWRVRSFRRRLQKSTRHAQALPILRWAAYDETEARIIFLAEFLYWLAVAIAEPDERTQHAIDQHMRAFEKEHRAYELLRKNDLADQTKPHLERGVDHLIAAHTLKRHWVPDQAPLLDAVCNKLWRLFGSRFYGHAALLVSAAQNFNGHAAISLRHTRHIAKKIRR
jgi:hypothetical protein